MPVPGLRLNGKTACCTEAKAWPTFGCGMAVNGLWGDKFEVC